MTGREVLAAASALVVADKGLLAIDENNQACGKRLAGARISLTGEARRACRALIVTTAADSSCFSASGNGRILGLSFASGSGPGVGLRLHSFAPLPAQHLAVRCSPSSPLPGGAKGGAGLGSGPLLPVRSLDVAA